jgi:hypothetical protein
VPDFQVTESSTNSVSVLRSGSCEVKLWAGYRSFEFWAVSLDGTVLARSQGFRKRGVRMPSDAGEARARYDELVEHLTGGGWEKQETQGEWFEARFARPVRTGAVPGEPRSEAGDASLSEPVAEPVAVSLHARPPARASALPSVSHPELPAMFIDEPPVNGSGDQVAAPEQSISSEARSPRRRRSRQRWPWQGGRKLVHVSVALCSLDAEHHHELAEHPVKTEYGFVLPIIYNGQRYNFSHRDPVDAELWVFSHAGPEILSRGL